MLCEPVSYFIMQTLFINEIEINKNNSMLAMAYVELVLDAD